MSIRLVSYNCRELIAIHKELEKMAYATQRRLENSEDLTGPNEEELRERLATLERDILVKKKQLHATSEDLTLMVSPTIYLTIIVCVCGNVA